MSRRLGLGAASLVVACALTALAADAPTTRAVRVTVDASRVPDLAPFAAVVQRTADEWYPRIGALLRPGDATLPADVRIVIEDGPEGIAWASGDRITLQAKWFRTRQDDVGAVVHELAHVVQAYPPGAPGWFVEGFADYIRWFTYEPPEKRPKVNAQAAKYDASYRTSAAFLDWVAREHGLAAVLRVDVDCRAGRYDAANWRNYTGRSIDELADGWRASLAATTRP